MSKIFYEKFRGLDRESLEEHLGWAANENDINTMKYLLTSPDLTEHPNIHAYDDNVLRRACVKNQLEMVRYLLTSPELKEHANIHASKDYCIKTACKNGHIELFKFLISSPQLKKKINIHTHNDEPFKSAFVSQQFDIIKCMVFDFKIEKTKCIKNFIESFSKSTDSKHYSFAIEVEDLFDKRDLHDSLSNQLTLQDKKIKKNKV